MAKISISTACDLHPNYKNISKEKGVLNWLIKFREALLANGTGAIGDIIPSKKELAEFLHVSTGTVQNALKYAEDMGLFTSKQCIGTMIAAPEQKTGLKMFSKKDKALIEIKRYLAAHQYEENEIIPGVCVFADELKTSTNTIRLAIFELIQNGFLRKETYKKNTVLILNCKPENKSRKSGEEIKNRSLSKIIKEDIKKYLIKNCKPGEKILPNSKLAQIYGVSVRTINSAMRGLEKEKIILSRRGNYGSVFISKNTGENRSLFMSKPGEKKSYAYKWEFAMKNIENYIIKNHEPGDKILSMGEFAKRLGVSVSTIKRAIQELRAQGVLFAQKGKYGGLFILEMPQKEDSYQWLAVNPEYFN